MQLAILLVVSSVAACRQVTATTIGKCKTKTEAEAEWLIIRVTDCWLMS